MWDFHILFLGLNLLFCFCESENRKVICDSSKEIILNENEIVFIESHGFPNSTTEEMMENCTINIFGNATDKESMSLTIVLTNFVTEGDFIMIDGSEEIKLEISDDRRPIFYDTTSSSLVFIYIYASLNDGREYSAFQGYIFYEKYVENNCGVVTMSQPLNLVDESEIIYIYAPENNLKNITCSWTFIAPQSYGFKFTSLDDISDATVIVKNSSDYIITADIYTKKNLPYYNVDNNITIILNANSKSPIFSALISIVKKNPIRTYGNCVFQSHDGYFTWSSSFYPNNAFCNIKTTISSNQQLFVIPMRVVSDIEKLADPLIIEIDDDKNNLINFMADFGDTTAFGPYENGTTKNLYWNILSDGSIPPLGFKIDFLFYECECNNLTIIVSCEDAYPYTLIDTKNIFDLYEIDENLYNKFYCANMNCNFTIVIDKKCPDKYIMVRLTGYIEWNSICKIRSNNQTILDLSTSNTGIGIIKPNSSTIFEFSSGPTLNVEALQITFQAYEKFKILPTITLTHDIPWQALDPYYSNERALLPIEISEELIQNNDTLQFSHSKGLGFPFFLKFYSDLNLTNIFEEYDINYMNLKSFVIFIIQNPLELINVNVKKASSENCKFQNTIFHTSDSGKVKFRISMISTDQGPCKMVIVNQFKIMVIKTLWTNANESKIEIFNGLNQQTKILEFNAMNASLWQFIVLNSPYYVIKIPAKSSIYIDSYEYTSSAVNSYKSISITSPCLSLLETNYYGSLIAFDPNWEGLDPIVYNIQNIFVQFTVRDYDVSQNGTLGFQDAKGNITMLTAVNQMVEYFSTNVTLIFAEPADGYKGARIYLKAFHKNIF